MGLITKEVEVVLNSRNIKYYEEKGYTIPRVCKKGKYSVKRGTTIIVNVKDLLKNSTCIVPINCDCCGTLLHIKFQDYQKNNHNGKYYCNTCASKIFNSGSGNPNYNSNLTDEERLYNRHYPEYYDFIKRVITRDNHTCQCCGKECNGDAEVHHLDGYDWCKERRTDDTNGITLCSMCHKAFHNKFGYGGNTKQQYEEWIGYAINDLKKYDGILPTARQIFDYERNEIFESACYYSKLFNVHISSVRNCCNHKIKIKKQKDKNGIEKQYIMRTNTVKGHHLFWLDEYQNMTPNKLQEYLKR